MDEKSLIDGHEFGQYDHNYYVSWSNALARLLARLGLEPKQNSVAPPQLRDVITAAGGRR
jgi:hypothetical protein